jgi:hypothetical protein
MSFDSLWLSVVFDSYLLIGHFFEGSHALLKSE